MNVETMALAAAAWLAGIAVALVATRAPLRRLAQKVARLEQHANSTGMDLKTLLREGALVRERQDQLELRASTGAAYEHAIDLARMGVGAEQLMESLGLTRGEAELLIHLHRSETAAAA